MRALQGLLIAMTIGIVAYTLVAGLEYGWNLVAIFVEELTALTWQGQFTFDFVCYLVLSALWVAWRHNFNAIGIALGLVASVAGILFFAPYLLVVSLQAKGDMKQLLLGEQRATA
ncbi:MAG: hypothetical protein RLP44_23740 [Aggregatilineales bacterium]